MTIDEFIAFHAPALEVDEVRHSLLTSLMGRLSQQKEASGISIWSLGAPGACAMMQQSFPIVLGDLSPKQCEELAFVTKDIVYAGVVGPDDTAIRFADSAEANRIAFADRVPQRILALSQPPNEPKVRGYARPVAFADFDLFRGWTLAFIEEAVPNDPKPNDESLRITLEQKRHFLRIADAKPVAMAAIARRTKHAATINSVFTDPSERNKGYAGSITAALVRRIFKEGRKTATLYADLRNPASNRCYEKLGFRTVCESWHVVRKR